MLADRNARVLFGWRHLHNACVVLLPRNTPIADTPSTATAPRMSPSSKAMSVMRRFREAGIFGGEGEVEA